MLKHLFVSKKSSTFTSRIFTLKTHNPELPFIIDNWNGNPINQLNQYINLNGPSERPFKELLKWQLSRNPFKHLKKNQKNEIPIIKNTSFIANRDNGFTWLGHATFVFTLNNTHFITDPVLYNLNPLKRYTELPCRVNDLKNINYILLSHAHRDHCDKQSLIDLCTLNPNAEILTGLGIGALLKKWGIKNTIQEAGWYQSYSIDNGTAIHYLPAKHWHRRGFNDLNKLLWGSFMLEKQHNNSSSVDKRIYFAADSGLDNHFTQIGNLFPTIDYALIGIGAYEPNWFMHTSHTSPKDALIAFEALNATRLVPMHYGTFDLSNEPIFHPIRGLKLLINETNRDKLVTPFIGEKISII